MGRSSVTTATVTTRHCLCMAPRFVRYLVNCSFRARSGR